MYLPAIVRHAAAVVAATASAAILYLIGRYGLGIEPDAASVTPDRVTLGSVLVTASMSSALGWALLAALERWTDRGLALWTRIAVTVTLVSLLGPLTTPDLTGGGRVLLSLLHLVVGGVTIVVLTRAATVTPSRDAASRPARA